MTAESKGLVRSLGRWTLAGLVLNTIIGSGVYGLPSVVSGKVGGSAWIAWVLAAAAIGVIVLCFAEVSSRFREAGGQYLYARVAFGPFVGVQMGWASYLVRATSVATNVNLLTIYLAEFLPTVGQGAGPIIVATVYLGAMAWLNVIGVKQAAWVSSALLLIKIVPLLAFAGVGLGLALGRGAVVPDPVAISGSLTWVEAVLVLIYAYGGFESAMFPLSEARNPERDAPFALLIGLVGCLLLFTTVQLVVTFTLPDAGSHSRALADAARALVGAPGATFMALGAVLSLIGWGMSVVLLSPRLTYAMAEHGDAPKIFGRVHPTYRTPAFSIVAFAVLSFVLAISGSFLQNLTIAVISRLFTYALVCLALPVLRRREGTDPRIGPARFRLPAGTLLAVLGVVITLGLAVRMTTREAVIMLVVAALASVSYWLSPARRAA
ncbi:MAG: APC family permease [Gemmatimonadales bacterium]